MTVKEYIDNVSEDRRGVFLQVLEAIRKGIPADFEECISYGMIGFVVPHSIYPKGYHCDPKLPLPFVSVSNQKNSINIYHMGIYADAKLLEWFVESYKHSTNSKLDMGKSCIRFNPKKDIPYSLIKKLCGKINAHEWIELYESAFKK
ncbi:MAG: DUF1801 domain-containing protein [Bacteroidetes bacterium]|nr:DUF1801 domain-containing protein [Bacteroidota bacterium]